MTAALILSENHQAIEVIEECLAHRASLDRWTDFDAFPAQLMTKRYDFIFLDIQFLLGWKREKGEDGQYGSIESFRKLQPIAETIILTPLEKIRDTVQMVKAGASDYITYPLRPVEVNLVLENLLESQRVQLELEYLRDKFWQKESLDFIRTRSPLMKQIFDKVRRVAETKATVLLTGETGTGKTMLARLLHRHSRRFDQPFVSLHCGAIPETLLESELFGHEKGAFTGAIRRKLGRFEVAQGGTIFLDEIGTIPPSMQVRFLQVLQEASFQRVGGEKTIDVDVRIVAATNEDLQAKTRDGPFRADLFYRLNVFPLELPPLRARLEDVPLLVSSFLNRFNMLYGKSITGVHPLVAEAMQNYDWPGNIRELENLTERAHILEVANQLTPEVFPEELFATETPPARIHVDTSLTLSTIRKRAADNVERQYLKELLGINGGKINKTSDAAGVTPRMLHKLMTKHGLNKRDFKGSGE